MLCRIFGLAFFFATVAIAWNLVALSGWISLGHAAFFGLGAYCTALADGYWQISAPWTLLLSGVCAALFGGICTLVFKNLRGAAFALATLASVEIPKVTIDNWESFTFGSLGVTGIRPLPDIHLGAFQLNFSSDVVAQYYLLFAFLAAAAWIHHHAIHSRWGWSLRAIRENEQAAAVLGVAVLETRLKTMVLSAFLTGFCGGMYAHIMGMIEPPLVFNLHISAMPLVFSILGGRYTWYGPIVGTLILYSTDQLILHPLLPAGHAAVYGLVIVLCILFFPKGLGSWLPRKSS